MDRNSTVIIPLYNDKEGPIAFVFYIFTGMLVLCSLLLLFIYFDDNMDLDVFLIIQGVLLIFALLAYLFKKYHTVDKTIRISYGDISLFRKTKPVQKFYRDDIKFITAYRNTVHGKTNHSEKISLDEAFQNPGSLMRSHIIIISKKEPGSGRLPVSMFSVNNSKSYMAFQANEKVRDPLEKFYAGKII